jgi:hypothetical protein
MTGVLLLGRIAALMPMHQSGFFGGLMLPKKVGKTENSLTSGQFELMVRF